LNISSKRPSIFVFGVFWTLLFPEHIKKKRAKTPRRSMNFDAVRTKESSCNAQKFNRELCEELGENYETLNGIHIFHRRKR
jgi:hypothetical protein